MRFAHEEPLVEHDLSTMVVGCARVSADTSLHFCISLPCVLPTWMLPLIDPRETQCSLAEVKKCCDHIPSVTCCCNCHLQDAKDSHGIWLKILLENVRCMICMYSIFLRPSCHKSGNGDATFAMRHSFSLQPKHTKTIFKFAAKNRNLYPPQ